MEEAKGVVVDCRATAQGAFTSVVGGSEGVVVRQYDISKTGNHWLESVQWTGSDQWVLVKDVSNSGKHRCYVSHSDGSRKPAIMEYGRCACEVEVEVE